MDDDAAKKMNGLAMPSTVANGSPLPPSKKHIIKKRQKSNFMLSLMSTLLRLALWGTILTVIFTCPSTPADLPDDSSRLCKSYVDLRSRISPHLEPSYHAYIKPYVDRAQPHIDQLNKQVYVPTADFISQHYNTYAAPRVGWVQDYAQASWADTVQPRLEDGRSWALSEYEQKLSPHVAWALKASDPYVRKAQSELIEIYDSTLVPLYDKSLPYVQETYSQGHYVTTKVVLPYVQLAHDSTSAFLSRHVWPQLVILYGENVEPQLMRITERLGRYRDSKKLETFIDQNAASASVASAASSASSVASAALLSDIPEPIHPSTKAPSNDGTVAAPEIPSETDIREKIESDLKTWQEKFAKAADKGAEDLEERVQEITTKQIEHQAHGVGNALVIQLENTVESSIRSLKEYINTSISKMPIEATDSEEDLVYEELLKHIKASGEKIRKRAVAVRTWKQNYDNETQSLVETALESTLDVIDNIRDLGLQEIGMRWAWMEGVTYKDWSKYHALKKTFDTWRDQVANAAFNHEGLGKAKEEGESVQDEGMKMAQAAATELMRLKDVTKWKVLAHDSSEDFSSKVIPARAVKAAHSIVSVGSETIKDAISSASSLVDPSSSPSPEVDYFEALKENVDEAISTVKSAASVASEKLAHTKSSEESTASEVSSTALTHMSEASEVLAEELSLGQSEATSQPVKVWGGAAAAFVEAKQVVLDEDFKEDWSEQISNLLEAAGDKASEITSAVSAALLKPTSTQGVVESATSLAQEQYAKALSAASVVLFGTSQPVTESLANGISDRYAQAVTAASYAIYGSPTPVVESLASQVQESLAYVTSMASARLADSLSHVSEQYTKAKIAVGAQPPALHQQYLLEAQHRYYQGIGIAHDQYSRFIDAVSRAMHGTPTAWYESIASEASKTIIGTPTPAYEYLFSDAKSQYDMLIAQASQKLNFVRSSASEVMSSTRDAGVEKILARASEMFRSATSQASVSFSSVTSSASLAIYGSSTGVAESIVSAASERIIGTEPSWNNAMASRASENYNALIAKASEQIYGTPTPLAQSVWNDAGEYAAQVTEAAASQYSVIQAIVSELVVGKEPDFTESVMSRLNSAYYTGAGAVAASASSFASEVYDSASSVISSVFTPPATLEAIIDSASEQFQAAVDFASIQIYGTSKGHIEQAASAVANGYSSIAAQASEAAYGKPPSYVEAAKSSVAAAASNAQYALSEAIYGTPTGYAEAAASSATSVYSSMASAAGENISAANEAIKDKYSSVSSQVSKAVYGPEYGTWESASSRIAAAAESASAKIASMMGEAGASAQSAASVVGSAASEVTSRVKDEL